FLVRIVIGNNNFISVKHIKLTLTPTSQDELLYWKGRLYWYNASLHASIGMTSFKVVYGKDPPTLTRSNYDDVDNPESRDNILNQLKLNLEKAQRHMNIQHHYPHFNLEDTVAVNGGGNAMTTNKSHISKLVRGKGPGKGYAQIMGPRRSSRNRSQSLLLKDYVCKDAEG
ncbi:hypothetical protein CR513_47393, partial [Mucuna pruriens]